MKPVLLRLVTDFLELIRVDKIRSVNLHAYLIRDGLLSFILFLFVCLVFVFIEILIILVHLQLPQDCR